MTHAEIEREMRAAVFPDGQGEMSVLRAVSVTERLLREQREKWGHAANCQCHGPKECDGGCAPEPFVKDPRCAPQEKP